jgi:hypothetical protein
MGVILVLLALTCITSSVSHQSCAAGYVDGRRSRRLSRKESVFIGEHVCECVRLRLSNTRPCRLK